MKDMTADWAKGYNRGYDAGFEAGQNESGRHSDDWKVWNKKLDEATEKVLAQSKRIVEVEVERDELRQKVAEYADAILKEYKGFGGRSAISIGEGRHPYPANEGGSK